MASMANQLAARLAMSNALGGGAALPNLNAAPVNPNALYGVGPTGPPQQAAGGIPPGWQAALAQMQARLAQGGGIPQPSLTASQLPQATLSPQALQAAGGILAGRRPILNR